MKIILPDSVNFIIGVLCEAGYEAYAVGGCVRDSLMGRVPADWDITTSAQPDDVKRLFKRTIDTGIEHGTVTVRHMGESFEVTTYRIDGDYEDMRHPKQVVFTSQLSEDLRRRDFTINAMAYNDSEGLIDIFGGESDLEKKIIRCVGDAKQRFNEDALRMMRAIRFAAQLGFDIDADTRSAICELASNIEKISAERIQVELVKLVTSDNPQRVRDLYETNLTKYFMPEFDAMMETPQNTKWHKYNVGEHTIVSMQQIDSDRVRRLTMLLHDMGKPASRVTIDNVDHFYGHPEKSAEIARDILRRLKFDNDTTRAVCNLVRYHDLRPVATEKSVRRCVIRVGNDAFDDYLAVRRADALAQSDYAMQEKLSQIDEIEAVYHSILEKNQCLKKSDLLINGRDIIDMGVKEGPMIGRIIDTLFDEVVEEPDRNNTKYLFATARRLIDEYSVEE